MMKMARNWASGMRTALLALMLALLLAGVALAGGAVDDAGLLSAEDLGRLAAYAKQISEAYDVDVAIYTSEALDGDNVYDHAEKHYEGAGYGEDGILLVLAMETRDMTMYTSGAVIEMFSDSALEQIDEAIKGDFSNGQYFEGFNRFLERVESHFKMLNRSAFERAMSKMPLSLIVALIVALIGMGILKKGMRTAVRQRGAKQYARAGSLKMRKSQDLFLYRTTVRKKIQSSSGGSSGGGSTKKTSSSGKTHGGRTSKF